MMSTYQPATLVDLQKLSEDLAHFDLWRAVRTYIIQFYADSAAYFTIRAEGEYDDEASIHYRPDTLLVFDENDQPVEYDTSKPAFTAMFVDGIVPVVSMIDEYSLYNHEAPEDTHLVLWGDFPEIRTPMATYNAVNDESLTFRMDKITSLPIYIRVDDAEA